MRQSGPHQEAPHRWRVTGEVPTHTPTFLPSSRPRQPPLGGLSCSTPACGGPSQPHTSPRFPSGRLGDTTTIQMPKRETWSWAPSFTCSAPCGQRHQKLQRPPPKPSPQPCGHLQHKATPRAADLSVRPLTEQGHSRGWDSWDTADARALVLALKTRLTADWRDIHPSKQGQSPWGRPDLLASSFQAPLPPPLRSFPVRNRPHQSHHGHPATATLTSGLGSPSQASLLPP